MKQLATMLLVAITLSGCSSAPNAVQVASNEVWQAQLLGGEDTPGFSFITQFTIGGNGTLSFSTFQFINAGSCFPVTGENPTGTMDLTINGSTGEVSGTFSLTVTANSNTLTLTGNVTGTETNPGTTSATLNGTTVTGNWTLAGGTGCNDTLPDNTFTMTLSNGSTSSSSAVSSSADASTK
jgi:hypothetical protein